jgi:predicted transcriptional regulator
LLKEVLKEIKDSKYVSKTSIAKKLNTTEDVIEQIFSELDRMGYIREDNAKSCNMKCKGCSFASLCNKVPINTVMITEKGEKLLNK